MSLEQQIKQEIEEERSIKKAKSNSEKRYRKLLSEWKQENTPKDHLLITDEMIERAKDYPIENIIDVVKGKARCLWHDDKNPSMSIRNNRAKCFVCNNRPQDAIAVYRQIHNCSFVDAVKALQ